MTPGKAALVQDGVHDDVRRPAPRQHPARARAARPRRRARRPGRVPRAELGRAGPRDVRHRPAGRRVRAGQHPAGGARAGLRPRAQRRRLLLVEDALADARCRPRRRAGRRDRGLHPRRAAAGSTRSCWQTTTPRSTSRVGLDDLFMIQYTSGTSGRPKGVMLTHGNVVWNVYNLLVDIDLTSDEVALVTAPLFHTAALNQVLFPTVLKGGTALIEAKFDPARAIDLIESERVTLLFGVTSMYLALAAAPRFAEADLASLRLALSGGAPIPESLLHTWLDRGPDDRPGLRADRGRRPARRCCAPPTASASSARRARPASSPTSGSSLSDGTAAGGEPGRGAGVRPQRQRPATGATTAPPRRRSAASGCTPATSRRVDDEGYLRDRRPAQGHVHLRRRERLSRRGRARPLRASRGRRVRGHRRARPDVGARSGRAFVVVRPGAHLDADEVLDHLGGRLARYKLPRSVVFVAELPHNASGKLLKSRLKDEAPMTRYEPRIDLGAITAIDVHVHVEADGHGHLSLDDELMDASAAYFKGSENRTPTVADLAARYRDAGHGRGRLHRRRHHRDRAPGPVERGDRRAGRRARRRADPVRVGRPAPGPGGRTTGATARRGPRRARLQVPPQPAGLLARRSGVHAAVGRARGARRARAVPHRPERHRRRPARAGAASSCATPTRCCSTTSPPTSRG